ncbi:uncharacterized protein LOC108673229 [Hyalella azteca]|uniref:Uncharacterized protein LOC108673229 n=1 Tax=Hyalella azteca TaxID=294128 RepID=A0A8B7NRY5_HYAAZ|nr:uncharacterized protein LOC108673229 [Hyalella azteca]
MFYLEFLVLVILSPVISLCQYHVELPKSSVPSSMRVARNMFTPMPPESVHRRKFDYSEEIRAKSVHFSPAKSSRFVSRSKRESKPKPLLMPLRASTNARLVVNSDKQETSETNERRAFSHSSVCLHGHSSERKILFETNHTAMASDQENLLSNISRTDLTPQSQNSSGMSIDPFIKIKTSNANPNCKFSHHKHEASMRKRVSNVSEIDKEIENHTSNAAFPTATPSLTYSAPEEISGPLKSGLIDEIVPLFDLHGGSFGQQKIKISELESGVRHLEATYPEFDGTPAHSNRISPAEGRSGLQQLVHKSLLNGLDGDTTRDFEAITQNNTLLYHDTSGALLHQLIDIKDILQSHASMRDKVFFEHLEYKYETLAKNFASDMEFVKMRHESHIDITKEKITLIMENLSTLKMMIFGQEQRILAHDRDITDIHKYTDESKTCSQNSSAVASTLSQQVLINATSSNESFPKINFVDHNVSQIVGNTSIITNKFEDIHERLDELNKDLVSYDSKLERFLGQQINSQADLVSKLKETNSLCQCNEDKLLEEIDSLKFNISNLSSSLDALQASTKHLIPSQKQTSEGSESKKDLNATESEVYLLQYTEKDVAEPASAQATMSFKLSALEDKLLNLDAEMQGMRDLRREVEVFRDELKRLKTSNSSAAGLCVWPYKPHGDGCYYVSTDERLSWGAARGRCRDLQGDLAAPLDHDAFKKFLQTQRLSRSYSFWVGASENKEAGRWEWVSGQPVTHEVWATGHPKLMRADRCMQIRPDLKLFASDESCRVSNYFVCQQRRA